MKISNESKYAARGIIALAAKGMLTEERAGIVIEQHAQITRMKSEARWLWGKLERMSRDAPQGLREKIVGYWKRSAFVDTEPRHRTLADASMTRVHLDERQVREVLDPNNPRGKRKLHARGNG